MVGATGQGRLLGDNLAIFNVTVVASVLLASLAVSAGVEVLSRPTRRALQT